MQKTLLTMFVVCALWVTSAIAQGNVTVQLRDGSKVAGRIEELTADGTLFVRVSQHDQRRIPIASVALIDRVGGANGLPDTELREATGSQHLLLLTNGTSAKGQLMAIRGGQGSAQENEQRTYVFRTENGAQQQYQMDQVARVYLGTYPFASNPGDAGGAAPGLDEGTNVPGAIRVPANGGWVNTGMRVRRGETITFNTTGEVQLSTNSADRARAAGTPRTAAGAQVPNVNVGGLIGRIGTGAPFAIGDQAAVPMPGEGLLYLAVNDDEQSDNSGAFMVQLGRRR